MAAPSSSAAYDPNFLHAAVPIPLPTAAGINCVLPYTHFSVNLDRVRGLAIATGVNIDGNLLANVARSNDWHLDPRIPEQEQTGEAVYARNDLDRGHLVRRRDPVWGDETTATHANYDTFAFTNAAPQAADFNQSKELWLGLEDHVLAYARAHRNRISVFTAPVLAKGDPIYRGVGIPQLFWKIAAWTTTADGNRSLRAAGFILDQRPQLSDIDLEAARIRANNIGDPPPLGPFRTFQVPIVDIATITGLDVLVLSEADALASVQAVAEGAAPRARWAELLDSAAVRL